MNQTKTQIREIAKKHGKSRDSLMPVLQEIVNEKNHVSAEDMVEVATVLDLSAAEVYGTASFYSFLDTEKRGKFVIRVCKSIIAEMKGKKEIIKTLEGLLKIKVGETTADGMFTLLETNDIGWSDKEPSMLINHTPFTELTPDKVISIIKEYRNKK
jgi:NADH:ubiquinone oxidoreductase subunit E